MKRLTFIIFGIILLSCVNSHAQIAGSTVYAGISMLGKGVSAGPIIGYKYQYDLPISGFGLIATADFTLNRLDKDTRDVLEFAFENWLKQYYYDNDESVVKKRNNIYISIPVNVGMNYSYPLGRISVFAEYGIGFSTLFSSKRVWKADRHHYNTYDSDYFDKTIVSSGETHYYDIWKYRPAIAFSYKFSFGAMLDDKWSVGLDVNGLSGYTQKSVHEEDYKKYYNSNNGSFDRKTDSETKVDGSTYLTLRLGYHF